MRRTSTDSRSAVRCGAVRWKKDRDKALHEGALTPVDAPEGTAARNVPLAVVRSTSTVGLPRLPSNHTWCQGAAVGALRCTQTCGGQHAGMGGGEERERDGDGEREGGESEDGANQLRVRDECITHLS
jgi:hypothetical protein